MLMTPRQAAAFRRQADAEIYAADTLSLIASCHYAAAFAPRHAAMSYAAASARHAQPPAADMIFATLPPCCTPSAEGAADWLAAISQPRHDAAATVF
jgi:hypothetical protein